MSLRSGLRVHGARIGLFSEVALTFLMGDRQAAQQFKHTLQAASSDRGILKLTHVKGGEMETLEAIKTSSRTWTTICSRHRPAIRNYERGTCSPDTIPHEAPAGYVWSDLGTRLRSCWAAHWEVELEEVV
jgi:hypothetical protein